MNTSKPIKVSIIGGGCAGVTAAFELTRPEHAGKYEVTLYQQGWRLGGKGASGRGPSDRIEEHGLHLWFGFYDNAFRLMRECYQELARDPERCRFADWQDAFKPDPFCGVMERSPNGDWTPWIVQFPPMPGLPGDHDGVPPRWTVADYLRRAIILVRTLLETIRVTVEGKSATSSDPSFRTPLGAAPGELAMMVERLMNYGGLAGLAGLIQGLDLLDEIARALPRFPSDVILSFHAALADSARVEIERMTARNHELRRVWEVVDIVLATVRGIIRHGLTTDPRGFDAIDEFECREWLKLNGASERSVNGSFLRAHYDLAFAYEDGDVTRPRIAAGQAVRAAVRAFFTYRGSFFWKMQAGMGDVVFAPFYEVLARRGVRFEFFHRLRNLVLGSPSGGKHIASLEFDVQAKIRRKVYEPLIDVRGLPCWPSEPDWDQLVDGQRMKRANRRFESMWDSRSLGKKSLCVGTDFDFVVLAVGLGTVPLVCSEIIKSDRRWQEMVSRLKTVPTQALQLWLSKDIRELGWKGPSLNISCYVEPFDTWADMPQLIAEESFPRKVGAIAYHCSVLRDASAEEIKRSDYPESRRKEVRQNAINFLQRDISAFWPNALDERGRFRWSLLVDAAGQGSRSAGESRIDSQFWTANVEPTDRYSLSLPGTSGFRISPLDRTYDNLTVAGDWTDCGFNEGCVEAAVMSGRLAAHALSQSPALEEIVGFDHP